MAKSYNSSNIMPLSSRFTHHTSRITHHESALSTQKVALLALGFFVLRPRPTGRLDLRHLGYRHVPPRFIAGHPLCWVYLHGDYGRAVGLAGFGQGGLE